LYSKSKKLKKGFREIGNVEYSKYRHFIPDFYELVQCISERGLGHVVQKTQDKMFTEVIVFLV